MVSGAVLVSDADADEKKHHNKKVGFYWEWNRAWNEGYPKVREG